MGTVANTGRAALVGAALLLAAGLPARSQSADDAARCLSIEDTDSRVECLEGTQDSVETPPAPAAAPTAPAAAPLPISKQQSVGRVSPSFDCAKASTAVQRTICRDSTLAEWDSRMGQLFRQASALQGKSKSLADEQRRWLTQRDSKCGSANAAEARSCVLEMTEARLTGISRRSWLQAGKKVVTARAEPDAPPEKKSETKRNQALAPANRHLRVNASRCRHQECPGPSEQVGTRAAGRLQGGERGERTRGLQAPALRGQQGATACAGNERTKAASGRDR